MSKKLTLRRLKGKDLIDALFRKGAKIQSKNLLLKVLESPKGGEILRVGVSVPKRNFKRAVDRNHIKRQLRIVFKEVQGKVPFSGAYITPHDLIAFLATAHCNRTQKASRT